MMKGGLLNAVKKHLTFKPPLGLSLRLAGNLSCLILSALDSSRTTSSRQIQGTRSARVIPLSHLCLRRDSGSHDHKKTGKGILQYGVRPGVPRSPATVCASASNPS